MYHLIPSPKIIKDSENPVSLDLLEDLQEVIQSKHLYKSPYFDFVSARPQGLPQGLEDFQISQAYELIIGKKVTLVALTDQGRTYGLITLEQVLVQEEVFQGTILDWPTYEHRGFMLDVARHFIDKSQVMGLIKSFAQQKMNYFHWHLSDDQGFRLDLNDYPKLAQVASKRKRSSSHEMNLGDDLPHSGSYTEEEVQEIVAFASKNHVTIIPEIDLPGHVSALIKAYPHLSCRDEVFEMPHKPGIYENVLCLGKADNLAFVDDILRAVMDLFPGPYFHMGGDEVLKTHWLDCPACRAKAQAEGIKTGRGLQAWFNNRMEAIFLEKGKQLILWNDAFQEGTYDPKTICQFWRGNKDKTGLENAMTIGSPVIYSPFNAYYMDYPLSFTSLEKTYNHGIPEGIKGIKGVELALWTELISSTQRLNHHLFPRGMAVAETGWNGSGRPDYDSFTANLWALKTYYADKNIQWAPKDQWVQKGPRAWMNNLKHIRRMLNWETLKAVKKMNQDDFVSEK